MLWPGALRHLTLAPGATGGSSRDDKCRSAAERVTAARPVGSRPNSLLRPPRRTDPVVGRPDRCPSRIEVRDDECTITAFAQRPHTPRGVSTLVMTSAPTPHVLLRIVTRTASQRSSPRPGAPGMSPRRGWGTQAVAACWGLQHSTLIPGAIVWSSRAGECRSAAERRQPERRRAAGGEATERLDQSGQEGAVGTRAYRSRCWARRSSPVTYRERDDECTVTGSIGS